MYRRRYTNCVVLPRSSIPGAFLRRNTCCLCCLGGNGIEELCGQADQPGKSSAELFPEETHLDAEGGLLPWAVIPLCIFRVGLLEIPMGIYLQRMRTLEK